MTEEERKSLSDELKKNKYSQRGVRRYDDPEVAKQKRVQTGKAQSLALGVLRERHRDEYDELYHQAKIEMGVIDAPSE